MKKALEVLLLIAAVAVGLAFIEVLVQGPKGPKTPVTGSMLDELRQSL